MTDKGERKVREWALKRNGDAVDNHDIVDLVFALDEDNEERHAETLKLLDVHCEEARIRDERLEALEAWREHQADTCEMRIKGLIDEEHSARHDAYVSGLASPRRKNDPESSDFLEQRKRTFPSDDPEVQEMRVSYRAGKWLIRGVAAAIIVALISFGANFYMNHVSTSTEVKVERSEFHSLMLLLEAEHGTPTPTPTP